MTSEIITQADRDAAANRLTPVYTGDSISETRRRICAGELDGHTWVQEAARARIASQTVSSGEVGEDMALVPRVITEEQADIIGMPRQYFERAVAILAALNPPTGEK